MRNVIVIRPQRSRRCGFCVTGNHKNCAIGVRSANRIHPCLCDQGGCTEGRRKCTTCGNRITEQVSPDTWECFDSEACRAFVEARREANPLSRELRTAKEKAAMAKLEKNAEKAEKATKAKEPTYCLVTGEPTKGGLFKPGMDARYVSLRVEEVTTGAKTEAQARKKMADDGISEKLVAKFDKSLAIARDKAAKREQAAKEKEAAKAEKAKEVIPA